MNHTRFGWLASVPYILLLGFLLVFNVAPFLLPAEMTPLLWLGLRWVLRAIYLLGAYWGWRLYEPAERPAWWYGWLGFAIYEAVALLLVSGNWLVNQLIADDGSWGALYLLLIPAAFLPYLLVTPWVAARNQQLALFTVFPHAALTGPLFVLVNRGLLGDRLENDILWQALAPVCVAGLIAGFWEHLSWPRRSFLLYGGVILSQLAFAIGLTWQDPSRMIALMLTLPLSMLGLLILAAPLLLLPMAQLGLRLIRRAGGGALLTAITAWLHGLRSQLRPPIDSTSAATNFARPDSNGVTNMSELEVIPPHEAVTSPPQAAPRMPGPPAPPARGDKAMERLFKWSVVLLTALAVLAILIFATRASVYKIHEYERGLHLRGGRFISVQKPGWHFQIPLVDTVIIVKVNERLGYVERIPAMASDNVTMIVSLQYTYRVIDPEQFALQVDDPERIVFEFVQGKLRDVINTKAMADVMNNRVLMNDEVMAALKEKETQYGVQFVTVQMQSASPPDEVLSAIKDRMVAGQRQEQAQAEAAQKKTQADADFYSAQKQAEAEAYQITKTAEAEAERIRLTTEVQQLSVRAMLSELEGKGALAEQYLQYLTAQALQNNSKWVIGGGTPLLDLRGGATQVVPPAESK